MYDHDEERVFAMMLRVQLAADRLPTLREAMKEIGTRTGLSIRVWSPDERTARPRLAICATLRHEPALALLRLRDGRIKADAALMLGNRPNCRAGRAVRRRLASHRRRSRRGR